MEHVARAFLMEQAFDDVLENPEQHHEDAEQRRFVDYGNEKRSVFETLAEPERIADQNHFGDDERLDKGEPVMEIGDPELRQDQPAVNRERAEEHGEVQRDDPEVPEFLTRPLLQAGVPGGLLAIHGVTSERTHRRHRPAAPRDTCPGTAGSSEPASLRGRHPSPTALRCTACRRPGMTPALRRFPRWWGTPTGPFHSSRRTRGRGGHWCRRRTARRRRWR